MKINLELPINSLSFGQVSYNLLREFYRRQIECSIFPIGPTDISAFDKIDPKLKIWIEDGINNRFKTHDRKNPLLKLWHLNGSQTNVVADKQILITFYETDAPTDEELRTINNLDKTLFTAEFYRSVFATMLKMNDIDEAKIDKIPLGFDEDFGPTGKTYYPDDTVWFLGGKFERRKFTKKILNLWAKKYGNNGKHKLICAVYNPFFNEEVNQRLIIDALEGKSYHNITFLNRMKTNSEVNDTLNCANIDLSGLSGGEAWSLMPFHSCGLGKQVVALNAHGIKEWANDKNSILVKPTGRFTAVDGIFFQPGPFSQGNFFDVEDEKIVEAMERAEKVAHVENVEGKKLRERFTYEKTVDAILKHLV